MMRDNETLLTGLNNKLADKKGRLFWRSLEELADTDEFKQWVEDEFPNRADLFNIDRRQFLKVGGAALAMAGLSGCRILPQTKAVPYVRSPEDLVSGQTLAYATTFTRSGYATGVLVEQYEGRPIKVEGNPAHPASLGATDVFEQAELLNMYDPDRSQNVVHNGEVAGWGEFTTALRAARANWAGGGLRILTGAVTSPLLTDQINLLVRKYGATWHAYEPINRDNVFAGTTAAFGRPVAPVYDLQSARVIVSLDADIFKTLPGSIAYARDWADGRRVRGTENITMNRLYVIESSTTITGASADHRYPVKPSQVEIVARAIFDAVSGNAAAATDIVTWLDKMVEDLRANTGAAVVVPGEEASPAVHAYAAAINEALGAVGKSVRYIEPLETSPVGHVASLTDLVTAMNAGRVNTLVILGGNPIYDAPADMKFAEALAKVPNSIQHALYQDETSTAVTWHVPATHFLETWGDARAFDGTTSLMQPLIAPLYDGNKSDIELIAELADEPKSGYDMLRAKYAPLGGANFEAWWQKTLIAGVVPNTVAPAVAVRANIGAVSGLTPATSAGGIEINFRPDPHIWDGRYANNSWLNELPRPVTTVTWDNVAIVSPATAQKIGATPTDNRSDAEDAARISGKSVVEITVPGTDKKVNIPVWILPGHPNDTITVTLGLGRTKIGVIGENVGQDVYPLRTSKTMSFAGGATGKRVKLKGTGDVLNAVGDATIGNSVDVFGDYRVATTQAQHLMRGVDIKEKSDRDIVRHGSLEDFITKKGKLGPELHHGGGEAEEEGELETDPKNGQEDIVADHGFNIPGLKGREEWKYSPRDPAQKTITNPEGNDSLYPEFSKSGYNAWAMSIDLTTCIGCNACTIACQAENNIPTVGKEQVGRGRAMHWIRIDHYFSTNAADAIGLKDPAQVESYFMPVPCMHCEKAPCEPVCPVAATIHSHEGLNQMVYNRCVGTRYCSNNCPYKVRRFNFLKWTAGWGGKGTLNFFDLPVLKLAANPEVTIRGRGVMEKCSYCVQRINAVRIKAKKESREIEDGEIMTACQQVCPTNAIIFGDLMDPNSQVSKLKRQPHDYGLLAELNTRPRTTYLSKVRNTNPAIPRVGVMPGEETAHEAHEGAEH